MTPQEQADLARSVCDLLEIVRDITPEVARAAGLAAAEATAESIARGGTTFKHIALKLSTRVHLRA